MTVKKIAELASVSIGTVDRVLHKRGNVSAEKRRLIEQIISETGYKPNHYARNLKLNKIKKIGYLTPLISSEDDYWNIMYQGVIRAHEDIMDNSFIIEKFEYDRNSSDSFMNASEKMLKEDVLGCIIVPKCIQEAQRFIKSHPELKYIIIDTELPMTDPVICKIGQNPFKGGEVAGKILSLLQPNAQRFLTFSFKRSFTSKARIRGFKEYFSKNTRCQILDFNINSVDEIPEIIKNMYMKYHSIDGIFCPCSLGYLVGHEVNVLGNKEETKIVTYDLIPKNKAAIRYGLIDCILSQRPVYQGYASVYQFYRYFVLGQQIENDVDVQIDILFKENLPEDFNNNLSGKLNPYCIPIR